MSYLELKYLLVDRLTQFLALAVGKDGEWNRGALSLESESKEFLQRVDALISSDELDAAEFLLESALEADTPSVDVQVRSARIAYLRGDRRLAIDRAREILGKEPNTPEAYNLLGQVYLAGRNYDEAQEVYEEFVDLVPDSPEGYVALGNVAYLRRDIEGAIAYYKQALQVDPQNVETRRRLSDAYEEQGRRLIRRSKFADAYQVFDLALRTEPEPNANAYFYRAYTFARAVTLNELKSDRGYAQAIEDYRKAIELNKRGGGKNSSQIRHAYPNLVELQLLQGDYKDAGRASQEYLASINIEETATVTANEIIIRFHQVVARVLAGSDYINELEALRARMVPPADIRGSKSWSFELLRESLRKRQPRVPQNQLDFIEGLIAEVEPLIGTIRRTH